MRITRSYLQEFYGIPTVTAQTTTWAYEYINQGFTSLNENGNPTVENTAYIGDKNSSACVTGYENSWDFETEWVGGDPVCEDIYDIAIHQKIGSECERKLISIDLSKPGTTSGTYVARQFDICVEANPPKGEPKATTKMSGVFHQVGDPVTGIFTLATKTFVADT